MLNPATCSSCGRAIIWTTSPTGARLPLTARKTAIYEIDEGSEEDQHTPDAIKTGMGYISHFVDCPSAAEHTRKK